MRAQDTVLDLVFPRRTGDEPIDSLVITFFDFKRIAAALLAGRGAGRKQGIHKEEDEEIEEEHRRKKSSRSAEYLGTIASLL